MTVLVTGSSGFIGQNLCRYLKERNFKVIGLDAFRPNQKIYKHHFLTFKPESTDYVDEFIEYRLGTTAKKEVLSEVLGRVNWVIHLAAQSHVDTSINDPMVFAKDNFAGTIELFEEIKNLQQMPRVILFSTDEVGACLHEGEFYEDGKFVTGSVYSASKAAQEHAATAYIKKYNMPIYITRCVNVFGPGQAYEKFLPRIIINALEDKKVPIYGSGYQQRQWVYVDHVCEFLNVMLLANYMPHGKAVHITGTKEIPNILLARLVLGILNKPQSLVEHVRDRLGHDERYALGRTEETDQWSLPEYAGPFDQDLMRTIEWYVGQYREMMKKVTA
ncbi:MAG: NAD-dependent epimerase/dehydratase family protein [Bacteroidetes bacterium]|nr:NAD-dependent epimerase/dehydratase family protein [Bacteroidota bacterium]